MVGAGNIMKSPVLNELQSELLFSGESGPEILARLRRDLLPTMCKGIMYWPICDFVTFKFIPVHLQVSSSTP